MPVVAFGNLQTKVKMHQLIVVEEKKGIVGAKTKHVFFQNSN
jgi:hypothetical protein